MFIRKEKSPHKQKKTRVLSKSGTKRNSDRHRPQTWRNRPKIVPFKPLEEETPKQNKMPYRELWYGRLKIVI